MSAGAWLRAWAALAAQTVVLVLYACTCVFALHLVPIQAGHIVSLALARTGDAGTPRAVTHGAGVLVVAHALATLVAGLVAAAIGARLGSPTATVFVIAIATIAIHAAWAPIALAPFAHVEGEGGVIPAIVRSFELSARRGFGRTLALGVELGALSASLAVVSALLARDPGTMPGAMVVWLIGAAPIAALRLALAYRDATSRAAFDRARDARVRTGLRTVVMLIAPAAAAVLLALGAAAITPTAMRPREPGEPAGFEPIASSGGPAYAPMSLPGDHGLLVVSTEGGVSIETADGGGAGLVELPDESRTGWHDDVSVGRARFRAREAWAAVSGRAITYFDDEGVRLDDEISDRLAARVGRNQVLLLLTALVLAGVLARALSRSIRDAAALDAPRWARDAPPPPRGALARIEGTLRLTEGARLEVARGRAIVHGAAHVDVPGADVVITLPPELPTLAVDDARLEHGAPLTLVAAADGLAALGPRQGAFPLPPGARLVPEERDAAAERVLARAARTAALLAIPIAAALAIAALTIVAAC